VDEEEIILAGFPEVKRGLNFHFRFFSLLLKKVRDNAIIYGFGDGSDCSFGRNELSTVFEF